MTEPADPSTEQQQETKQRFPLGRVLFVLMAAAVAASEYHWFPHELNTAAAAFFEEAGVLCVVFGIIDPYLEGPTRKRGVTERSIRVVLAGVFSLLIGVGIAGWSNIISAATTVAAPRDSLSATAAAPIDLPGVETPTAAAPSDRSPTKGRDGSGE